MFTTDYCIHVYICCKVQEPIIVSSILKRLDAHQILTDCQCGCRARRSCEIQLLTLAHELLSSLYVGYQHNLIILDFSKAIDRVPHERLLKKLDHYGIRDQGISEQPNTTGNSGRGNI